MFDQMYRMIVAEELWKCSETGMKFIATFKRKSYYRSQKVGGRLENRLAEELVEKGAEYLTQKTTQKIIEAITKKSDITQKELAAIIGITEDGVKYHITRLRKKGLLKRIGPDKGGH
ncbi:MAG: winged helix-turn-helix domain-containing protein, partial [Nitrospirae bacterium]|nr:winged helix-turn-helix domain-containing protein [Nitrospirota bacterium]